MEIQAEGQLVDRRSIGGELSKDQTEISTLWISPRRKNEANINASGKKKQFSL